MENFLDAFPENSKAKELHLNKSLDAFKKKFLERFKKEFLMQSLEQLWEESLEEFRKSLSLGKFLEGKNPSRNNCRNS